ncbi:hypothetical protein LINPERHAP2_LOCUS29077 [Linum perenne]
MNPLVHCSESSRKRKLVKGRCMSDQSWPWTILISERERRWETCNLRDHLSQTKVAS